MPHRNKPCSKAKECDEYEPAERQDTEFFVRKLVGSKHFVAVLTGFFIYGVGGVKDRVWPQEDNGRHFAAIHAEQEALRAEMRAGFDRLDRRIDDHLDRLRSQGKLEGTETNALSVITP